MKHAPNRSGAYSSLNQVAGQDAAPKGSFLAYKRTGNPGHFLSLAKGSFLVPPLATLARQTTSRW